VSDSGRNSILPPNWDSLGPLVDAVLDEPPENRSALINQLCNGDPESQRELAKIVMECERELPLLDRPAAERFASLFQETDEPSLPPILGGRYVIDREVGRGGMARVFLAHDRKHARDVAVKVIRQDLAATLGSERFLREIAIAARLRHPNIVPMYDSGETDGILFFVMPFEEGRSLKERITDSTELTLTERISVLRDIARALAYAHERGVVHRDIKPENILLSGGAAVVSDFGIAKAVTAAQTETSDAVITQSGARIGTPTYMAPEQAVADPATDHRADIYSFGCLAYELFAYRPPFEHATTHEIIAAHVGVRPVPIRSIAPGTPRSIADLIMRCLEKRPVDRPQKAQDLLTGLEAASTGESAADSDGVPSSRRKIVGIIAVTVGLLMIGGFAYSRATQKNAAPADHELTVAVLPLDSRGDSLERELAYGLSEEIAVALVNTPGVRVKSGRGAAASRDGDLDPAKTGKALGVEFLVTGSLKQEGNRLMVLAKLVRASDAALVWAEQYDRSYDDLRMIRQNIASAVGDSLRRRSGAAMSSTGIRHASRVPAAEPYYLYVLATQALNRRGQSIETSAAMFRRATELDTLYAEAFGGLSLALALTPHFKPVVSSMQVAAEASAAAHRALRLDSTLAQPHVALGIVHGHAYRWDSAGIELRAGVRLRDESDVEPLVQYGRFLLFRGQTDEALKQFILARDIEPASAVVRSWVSYAQYLKGDMADARVENRRAFLSDSTNVTTLGFGALILLKEHDPARARDYTRRINRYFHIVFFVLAATGDTAEARKRLAELEKMQPPPWLLENSRAFTLLGARDTIGAISAFERATDAHDIWPSQEAIDDPIFDPVRSHPRFQRLLRRVGLK